MAAVTQFLAALDQAKRLVRGIEGRQIFSTEVLSTLHSLGASYFTSLRPYLAGHLRDASGLAKADEIFQELIALSRRHPSKDKCLLFLADGKSLLVKLEGLTVASAALRAVGSVSRADELIISTLEEICPSASLAYQQALADLAQTSRFSWRGPATDLREALRETLDILAPDVEIEKAPGYKPEADAKRPTMKQKARFILKNRGLASGQLEAPDSALKGLEEMLGGLTRSVYTRSSVSTHTPTTREEVLRVHAWVRLILCELLALPVQ